MRRAAKGRVRAEQLFFEDPAVDGLMGVLMALATEHYVLRDRVRVLEQRLAQAGHTDAAEFASPEEDAETFACELLRPLLGLQDSVGTGGRFSLKATRRRIR